MERPNAPRRRYSPLIRPNPAFAPGSRPTRSPRREKRSKNPVWAYGVTTYAPKEGEKDWRRNPIPNRRDEGLLTETLRSLTNGGFPGPTLFVDGVSEAKEWEEQFGLEVVLRRRRIGAFGNWILGLAELMIRQPHADYYAMFQDDFITSKNLRPYLETVVYPERGYLNLYTFPRNQMLSQGRCGFYPTGQTGQGAVALVFDRETALAVISDPDIAKRPRDRIRGHKFIDGGVVTSMKKQGYIEYCHNPSLVQHTGFASTLTNPKHPRAASFRGEEFDLMSLLEPESTNV